MKLFHSPNSPFSRKCRVVAIEKGIMDKIELIEASPSENPPELWAVNPLGTVPAMAVGNGLHLSDSSVICEYLNTLSPEPDLYADRICVLPMAFLAEGILNAAVACVMEGRRPPQFQYPAWVSRKEAAISRAIAKFAGISWENAPLSIGTISLGVALEYVSFRLPHLNWREAHPELAKWADTFGKRLSMAQTAPKA
jgi:glutathione S-transferase